MTVRRLAAGLALSRSAFGLGYLVAPARSGRGWIGAAAERPEVTVLTRAMGARDLPLGLGALRSLTEGQPAHGWLAAHAISDGTDLVATWIVRRRLPRPARSFALGMAGASTAVAVAYLVAGGDDGAGD